MRVLIYTPPDAAAPLPVYLDIHGGSYVAGTAELDGPFCRAIAKAVACAVVSVDYRIAPETRWPGAVEDCYAALRWVAAEGAAHGFDPARLAIGGESAGGGLTAALALYARRHGGPQVALQMLGQPMLDDRTGLVGEPHPWAGEYILTADSNRTGWSALLGVDAGSHAVPVEAVPARVADLVGLPPAFVMVGALDLLVEEGIEYARRLIRAGVPTELHVIHGATAMVPDAELSRAAAELMFAALRRALGTA